MSLASYRIVEHTADMAFEVEAPSFAGLLEIAVDALSDLILAETSEPETLAEERRIVVTGADREDVLVAWLTEALLLLEEDGVLARTARVEGADAERAEGVFFGRRLDLSREAPDRVVKAITYHDLAVEVGDDETPWRACVVLDL